VFLSRRGVNLLLRFWADELEECAGAGIDFRFFRVVWASSLPFRMKNDKRKQKSKRMFRSKVLWTCFGNDIDH
jgi:hypothetical protein